MAGMGGRICRWITRDMVIAFAVILLYLNVAL